VAQLPESFRRKVPELQEADLLLVLGTSLTVYPFAALTRYVPKGCPRVLFNLEEAGDIGERSDDVLALDQCDTGVRDLARLLGWEEELDAEWAATAMKGADPENEGVVSAKGEEQPKEEGLSGTAKAEDNVEKLAADIAGSLNIGNTEESKTTTDASSSAEIGEVLKSSDDEPKSVVV
jgi:NAD+-dependent protein deacetylase SIR2